VFGVNLPRRRIGWVRPDEILAAPREKFLGVFRFPSTLEGRSGGSWTLANKSRVFRRFDLDQNGTDSEFNRFLFGSWPDQCSSATRVSYFTWGSGGLP
jgi:hypothetical protein